MPVSVLIPPDNRLLGWTMSDLTLYGAPPMPGVAIGAASDEARVADDAGATDAVPTPDAAPPEGETAAYETTALLDRADAQPALAPVPVVHGSVPATDHDDAAPFALTPQPIGSSGAPLPPVATPLQTVAKDHAAPSAESDALAAFTHDAGAPIAALTPIADVGTLPLLLADTLVGEVAPTTLASVDTLAGEAVPAALTTADTLVGDVAPEVLASVDTVVGAVPDTVATVDTLAGDVAGTVLDPPLSAFGGSDPAAGVQTLIGMVESADAFDLGHAVTAHASDLTSSGSILDALAADEVAPALLGDGHGAASEHPLDDHGIHLGL